MAGPAPVRTGGGYVLYWMIAQRRLAWNHALDRAVGWAIELGRPLLVLEPLGCRYPWASDRLHRFVLDGMADHAAGAKAAGITYYPYVEPRADAGKGLLQSLAAQAAVVITDDYPAFVLPRLAAAAARCSPARLEAVDSNGIVPLGRFDRAYPTAYAFRRSLQRELPAFIHARPDPDPLRRAAALGPAAIPADVLRRWPKATPASLSPRADLSALPIDHAVMPVAAPGGPAAARRVLRRFLDERLPRYTERRTAVEEDATSGLSPYLHFGHISSSEIVHEVLAREGWLGALPARATGARDGWWGVSAEVEAFLDQVITWRELGFNACARRDDYDRYESLPPWARATLAAHAGDEREHVYTLEQFERAATHDPLWNAAQRQLLREGRIHNYLRMLWGKKVLEWSGSPGEALGILLELNNKYALDGRDPNSYSGIFWTLGRYDRPWGPERPVFGSVRYMSSTSTAKKMDVKGYLRRFAG